MELTEKKKNQSNPNERSIFELAICVIQALYNMYIVSRYSVHNHPSTYAVACVTVSNLLEFLHKNNPSSSLAAASLFQALTSWGRAKTSEEKT